MHAWSVLFNVAGMARSFAVPLGVVAFAFVFGGGDGVRSMTGLLLAGVSLVIAGLVQVVRFLTMRYRFDGNDLVVRVGLIFRSERRIPMAKVQNIDLVQNVVHRLFNVAKVKLETASGAGADASFSVLDDAAISELRTRVFAKRDAATAPVDAVAETPAEDEQVVEILRLSTLEVVKLGLMTFRGIVLVAVVVAIGFEAGLDSVFERVDVEEVTSGITSATSSTSRLDAILIGSALVASVLLGLAVLSIAWSLLRFHGFRLTRSGEDLRVESGLLTKVSATVPRGRIQFISVRETLVHRLLNRVTVRVENAGGKAAGNGEQPIGEKWIAPLVPVSRLPQVLNELRPGLSFDDLPWQPVAPRARWRMSVKALIGTGLVSALIIWLSWQIGLVLLVLLLFFELWSAKREADYRGCALTEEGLWFRSGAFTRQQSVAPLSKVQTMHWTQSPFDRRHGHATLRADTAGAGPSGHFIAMRYFPVDKADAMCHELYTQVARTELSWN